MWVWNVNMYIYESGGTVYSVRTTSVNNIGRNKRNVRVHCTMPLQVKNEGLNSDIQ